MTDSTRDHSASLARRRFLQMLLGGSAGVAAIATGLPRQLFVAPKAFAAPAPAGATFVLFAASDRGEPMNANCPGSYAIPGVSHPDSPEFLPATIRLGTVESTAASLWNGVPQWVLDRSCFIHHATRSAVHSEMPKILRLGNTTENDEQLPSLIAKNHAASLGTIQSVPVNLGRNVAVTYEGSAQPRIRPLALKQLFASPESPLASLREIRDRQMDRIHAILRREGTAEQRAYLDANALSRTDARRLADDAESIFAQVLDDEAGSEVLAAIGLFRLGVTPVVTVSLPFGGDNHSDAGLQEEISQHHTGIETLTTAMTTLQSLGMQDQVTVAVLNVFGRTLRSDPAGGRDHWSRHSVSLVVGPNVRPGVVGGMRPTPDDFECTNIDPATGSATDSGGIAFEDSLASTGKTLWAAAGGDRAAIDRAVPVGQVITGALAG